MSDTTDLVAATWPRWRERAAQLLQPTNATCNVNHFASLPDGCMSPELHTVYTPTAKTGSGFVRTMLYSRYGQSHSLNCPKWSEKRIDEAYNGTSGDWSWFAFVRDPLERFLSAVAEVSTRHMPHPPVERSPDGSSWRLRRVAYNTSLPTIPSAGVYPENRLFRGAGTYSRHMLSSWYPANASERLSMLVFLVIQARPRWEDVHFQQQWPTLRAAARAMPNLTARGFVGDTCSISELFEKLQASESSATRARRDALSWAELHLKSGRNITVHHVAKRNQKRHLTCEAHKASALTDPSSAKLHEAQAQAQALRAYDRCLIEARRADEANPYPDEETERRIRAHYALDYTCLGLEGAPVC